MMKDELVAAHPRCANCDKPSTGVWRLVAPATPGAPAAADEVVGLCQKCLDWARWRYQRGVPRGEAHTPGARFKRLPVSSYEAGKLSRPRPKVRSRRFFR